MKTYLRKKIGEFYLLMHFGPLDVPSLLYVLYSTNVSALRSRYATCPTLLTNVLVISSSEHHCTYILPGPKNQYRLGDGIGAEIAWEFDRRNTDVFVIYGVLMPLSQSSTTLRSSGRKCVVCPESRLLRAFPISHSL